MKKIILALSMALFLSFAAHAREPVPIINFENLPITTASGKKLSRPEIRAAILRAGAQTQWNIAETSGSALIGTLNVRSKHSVTVSIRFTAETFSITYNDSIDMKYRIEDNTPVIHPFYNKWVQTLVNNIRTELLRS